MPAIGSVDEKSNQSCGRGFPPLWAATDRSYFLGCSFSLCLFWHAKSHCHEWVSKQTKLAALVVLFGAESHAATPADVLSLRVLQQSCKSINLNKEDSKWMQSHGDVNLLVQCLSHGERGLVSYYCTLLE